MVLREPAPKASLAVAAKDKIRWRNIPKLKQANLLRPTKTTQGVIGNLTRNSRLQLQLAPPLTKKARRIITAKTDDLMRKRDELDKAVLNQASRPLESLKAADWLPRENILRQCERLAKREKRHIRFRTRVFDEYTRLYKVDPSTERAADLDLIRELLWKFKHHLGPYLVSADKPKYEEDGDSTSSSGPDASDDKACAEVPSSSSSGDALADEESPKDQEPSVTGDLDGAFDDTVSLNKRKADNLMGSGKEPQKKAKKEQTTSDIQSHASKSPSDKPIASQRPLVMEEFTAAINAEIGNMSQAKQSKIVGDSKEKVDRKDKDITTARAPRDDGSLMPFYKFHAKAMMQPNFNDHVHDRPLRRRGSKRPIREYIVHGALPAPRLPGSKQEVKGDKTKKSSPKKGRP